MQTLHMDPFQSRRGACEELLGTRLPSTSVAKPPTRKPKPKPPTPMIASAPHPFAGLNKIEIGAKLREARENVVYWNRQRALCSQPQAKARAGALHNIWKGQVAALEARLIEI